jgi:hypothetical protein
MMESVVMDSSEPQMSASFSMESNVVSFRVYFTHDQIARMRTATTMLASLPTWHAVDRYFDGY